MKLKLIALSFLAVLSSILSLSMAKSKNGFLPKNFKSSFVQEHKSKLKGKIVKSYGKVEYSFPSQIRFEIDKPDKLIYVSNKKLSWYYTAPFIEGEPGTLNIRKSEGNGLHRFFDSLKGGLTSNKLYKVKKSGVTAQVTFSKKIAKELEIAFAVFKFKEKGFQFTSLKTIEVTYLDKRKVKLDFTKINTNISFKKDHFTFNAPKNTRINQ